MPEIPVQQPTSPKQSQINWKRVLIISVVVSVIIGLGILIFLILQPKSEPSNVTTTKQASPSAKKDETSGWKTIENDVLGYSIKYPNGWGALRCKESSTDHIDDKKIQYSNPEYSKVLAGADYCSSGARARIVISRGESFSDEETSWDKYGPTQYTEYNKEEVVAGGKNCIKIYAISKQGPGIQEGVEFIEYIIDDGKNQALIINYYRPPDDDLNPPYTDYSDTLEKMINTLKFLD